MSRVPLHSCARARNVYIDISLVHLVQPTNVQALRAENIRRAELAGQFGSKVFGSAAVAQGCRAR